MLVGSKKGAKEMKNHREVRRMEELLGVKGRKGKGVGGAVATCICSSLCAEGSRSFNIDIASDRSSRMPLTFPENLGGRLASSAPSPFACSIIRLFVSC